MGFKASDLWRWDGTVSRAVYAGVGLVGFALKHNIDRIVATQVFQQPWSLFNYLVPGPSSVSAITPDRMSFYGTLLLIAVPFIWTGVCLTLRRLRAAHLPLWLVILFFMPLVNLVFFIILALLPSQSADGRESLPPHSGFLDRVIPDRPLGAAMMSLLLLVPVALLATYVSVADLGQYGWSLFVGLPFCLGLGSVLIYGYHRERSLGQCLLVASTSVILLAAAMMGLAIEGVICLMMAAPLGVGFGVLGGIVGWAIQRRRPASEDSTGFTPPRPPVATLLLALTFVLPALLGAEWAGHEKPEVYAVTSSLEVNAPPEKVWPFVIHFSRLPEPDEWIFKLGVAYPIQARLQGEGVGAIRHCVFSTGPFVEPIQVWDAPHHLAFSVTSNPDPLQEWTPYHFIIHPNHLDGYLASQGGEFRLSELPGGRTRLQGTTWYRHGLWPACYWRVWSDEIIHLIHLRVLRHIKNLSEESLR